MPPPSSNYPSFAFVESAGAVLFHLSTRPPQVCLLYLVDTDEYVLAKGRRNLGENVRETAVREVREETGLKCVLLPVRMSTRAPPPPLAPPAGAEEMEIGQIEDQDEVEEIEDKPRKFDDIIEPFHLQIRHLDDERSNVKIIWWFIAAVNIEEDKHKHEKKQPQLPHASIKQEKGPTAGEKKFRAGFFRYEEALEKLTFESDREVVRCAIEILEDTYDH